MFISKLVTSSNASFCYVPKFHFSFDVSLVYVGVLYLFYTDV